MPIACCFALVGGFGACHSPQKPAPAQEQSATPAASQSAGQVPLHKLGQTADAGAYRLTVRSIRTCVTEPYFLPRPGNIKLGVSVAIENSSPQVLPVNPFYARLSDAKGSVYYFTLAGCEPILDSTRLDPGEKVEGWLTFEVPVALRKVELAYRQLQANSASRDVRFEIVLDE